jgi:hypothetical protein
VKWFVYPRYVFGSWGRHSPTYNVTLQLLAFFGEYSYDVLVFRMQASGAEKRFEGNAEHDTAQAKQYAEGASDSLLGGKTV